LDRNYVSDFAIFSLYYAFFTSLYVGLTYGRENRESFDYGFFLWAWANIYLGRSVLIPCLETFWIFSGTKTNANADSQNIPLSDVLATQLGYNYFFAHLLNEFSEENLLCWKAIEVLRRNTSYQRMMDIYTKFIEDDAVFMVNIPGALRALTTKEVKDATEQTSLQIIQSLYNNVQIELFRLMQGDSFVRFKSSNLFARYQAHEPFDMSEESESSSSNTSPRSASRGSRSNSFAKPGGGFIPSPSSHGLNPASGERESGTARTIKLELGTVTGRDSLILQAPPSPTASTPRKPPQDSLRAPSGADEVKTPAPSNSEI